jgi:O-antigen/teichoic acid export membrane protein
LGSFIGFVTTFFIITRYLTPAEVGFARVFFDTAFLFASLAQLGTSASVMRYYPYFKNSEKKDHGFFFWTLLVPLVGFLLFLVVFFLFKGTFIHIFSKNASLLVDYYDYLVPMSFFLLYIAVFETNSNVLMRIAVPKFIREVLVRVLMILVYLLYGFKVISLRQFVIDYCVVYLIALVCNIIYQFKLKKVSLKPDMSIITPPLRKDFLFYTGFLVVSSVSGLITTSISSLAVSAKMNLDYAGILTVAGYIATIVEIPYRSLSAIASPNISIAIKNDDKQTANNLCQSVSLHQLLAGSLVFYVIWINIDVIYQILPNGDIYAAGKWAVLAICLYRLFNSVCGIGPSVLGYSRYYYLTLIFTILLTCSTFVFTLWWIPYWGIVGAAFATFVSFIIYYTSLLWVVKRKMAVTPFSFPQLKVVGLLLALFLLNAAWEYSLAPVFAKLPLQPFWCNILNRLSCTLLMLVIAIFAIYKMKISEQVNMLIRRGLKKTGISIEIGK